jgi:hypothetical protein
MKKLVFLSLLLALLASAVFAQEAGISFGGWGRGAFAPFIGVGEYKNSAGGTVEAENYMGTGVTWGNTPNYEFNITGTSDYVGFGLGLNSSSDANPIGGNDFGAHVWVKPFSNDWLKITVGNFNDDTLRGKIGSVNGGFEYFGLRHKDRGWANPISGAEEDAIFTRFGTGTGFLLTSAPVEGLYIGAKFGTNAALWEFFDPMTTPPTFGGLTTFEDGFKHIQFGLGYEIANVGLARLQIQGGKLNYDDELKAGLPGLVAVIGSGPIDFSSFSGEDARIEAAFAFTGLESLVLDFGLKFYLPVKAEAEDGGNKGTISSSKGLSLGLGASFNSGAFGIKGRVDASFAGNYSYEVTNVPSQGDVDGKYSAPLALAFRLVPSFDLGFATVGLDFGLGITGESKTEFGGSSTDGKDGTFDMGFGAFIAKGFGNGSIKAGLAYSLPHSVDGETENYPGIFTIPVILEYSF